MLLAITQFKVDVFSLIKEKLGGKTEFFATKGILEELTKIGKAGEKQRREIELIKELMEKNKVELTAVDVKNTDDGLVELSKKGFYVASNDKALRKRIKSLGGQNIYLRRKKLVEIE
jgi:rRNA-processing protein FCF1|tara:strand:+ start:439 stop:789 length:351 start_codon:yes stop_codon:yes gene_type:complete